MDRFFFSNQTMSKILARSVTCQVSTNVDANASNLGKAADCVWGDAAEVWEATDFSKILKLPSFPIVFCEIGGLPRFFFNGFPDSLVQSSKK